MADEEFWRRFLEAQERVRNLTPEQLRARLAELRRIDRPPLSDEQRRDFERLVAMGEAALLSDETVDRS